jgi:hypothetical protein
LSVITACLVDVAFQNPTPNLSDTMSLVTVFAKPAGQLFSLGVAGIVVWHLIPRARANERMLVQLAFFSGTLEALEPVIVYEIKQQALAALLAERPALAQSLTSALAHRGRRTPPSASQVPSESRNSRVFLTAIQSIFRGKYCVTDP